MNQLSWVSTLWRTRLVTKIRFRGVNWIGTGEHIMVNMHKKIVVAPGLAFDAAELATEVVASLGNRGGGKSNGASVIAEGLIGASVQVVVLDYVGIWFSICLAEDGKTVSPYRIPVLGGAHGDISLAATSGAVVAEALASRRSSAILDISGFSKQDRCRFATDFAEAFFRAKKRRGLHHRSLSWARRGCSGPSRR